MSRIALIYHTNIKFYTQYTHPTLIYRGTDAHTDGRMENIYSIFRDKLLLLGEHVLTVMGFIVGHLLRASTSSLMKIEDAPVSAIPCVAQC
jgi:hypothetical protein